MWQPITFVPGVNYFDIKYTGVQHAKYLLETLTILWHLSKLGGNLSCGISLKWNYNKCTVNLPMLAYIQNELTKFQHLSPKTTQDSPHKYISIKDRLKMQTTPINNFLPLNNKQIRPGQEIVDTLPCSKSHLGLCTQLYCSKTSTWNQGSNWHKPPIAWLCCYTS